MWFLFFFILFADAQFSFLILPNGTEISYLPATFGGSLYNATGSVITGRVVIPSDPLACTKLDNSPGKGYGEILLISRGLCGYTVKAAFAAELNPLLIIIWNCEGSSCPYARVSGDMLLDIPVIGVNFADGQKLATGIANGDLFIEINGTGPIDPDEKAALVAFATNAVVVQNSEFLRGRLWSDLLDPAKVGDPCIDRISGIWCIDDRIVELMLTDHLIQGPMPKEIGGLSSLRRLIVSEGAINGTIPCEIGNLTQLIQLVLSDNDISGLPMGWECWNRLQSLQTLYFDENNISEFPSAITSLSELRGIFADYNNLSSIPSFQNMTNLIVLSLLSNKITGNLDFSNSFIQQLDLSSNLLTSLNNGHAFDNMTNLIYIDISSNRFDCPLPFFNHTNKIRFGKFDRNNFTDSIPDTWYLPSIRQLYLARNKLDGPFSVPTTMPILQVLDLSYNRVTAKLKTNPNNTEVGAFLQSLFSPSISSLNLQHNLIYGNWSSGWISINTNNLQKLNLANNQLLSFPPDVFNSLAALQLLDLADNQLIGVLPSTLSSINLVVAEFKGNPQMGPATLPPYLEASTTFLKTRVTDPFVCPAIVGSTTDLSITIDASYYMYAGCQCDSGRYGQPPDCLLIPPETQVVTSQRFTDGIYGTQRLQQGVDTRWQVNPNTTQHIEAIAFYVQVTGNFSEYEDVLAIYEGGSDLRGDRVWLVHGTDTKENFTLRPSDRYISENTTFIVMVFSQTATLTFESRDPEGVHFNAHTEYYTYCPAGFTSYLSTKCRLLRPYEVPLGAKVFVYVLAALVCIFVLWVAAVVSAHQRTVIIKASSPIFCYCALFGIFLLSAGSTTYTASPKQGKWVCDIRPWLTALSIIIILSNLLVKAHRVKKLFHDMTLEIRKFSNKRLGRTVGIMLSIEFFLLIIFTTLNLSTPRIVEGNGSDADVLIEQYECTTLGTGYTVFIVFQFVYVGIFVIWGAYIAFYTKDTPTAFNESTHILWALWEIIFFALVLIPIDFILQSSPSAVMVTRSLGQCFAALTICLTIFAPKLYYIFTGNANQSAVSQISAHMSEPSEHRGSRSQRQSVRTGSIALQNVDTVAGSVQSTAPAPSTAEPFSQFSPSPKADDGEYIHEKELQELEKGIAEPETEPLGERENS